MQRGREESTAFATPKEKITADVKVSDFVLPRSRSERAPRALQTHQP
jgi:hypothetical protein